MMGDKKLEKIVKVVLQNFQRAKIQQYYLVMAPMI